MDQHGQLIVLRDTRCVAVVYAASVQTGRGRRPERFEVYLTV